MDTGVAPGDRSRLDASLSWGDSVADEKAVVVRDGLAKANHGCSTRFAKIMPATMLA
jgi:hypothetical protein